MLLHHSLAPHALGLALICAAPASAQGQGCDLGWVPAFQDLSHQLPTLPFSLPTPTGRSIGVLEDGPAAGLYLSGEFGDPENPTYRVLRFSENASQVVADGFPGNISDLCGFDDGSGSALYASFDYGAFLPGYATLRRWDGTTWSVVPAPQGHEAINALTTFDDGTGEKLVAALSSPSAPSDFMGVAAYDGQTWSPLGEGLFGFVEDFEKFELSSGTQLIAGGGFTEVGAPPFEVKNIARFDGGAWKPLGEGFSGAVRALELHVDGDSPAIFVSGLHFDSIDGEAQRLRSWNGSHWRAIEGVLDPPLAMASVQPGGILEPGLYAGFDEDFSSPTQACVGLGRWDGVHWQPVGTGLPGSTLRDLHVYGEGAEQSLFGAFFGGGADSGDRGFARFGCGAAPRYVSIAGCDGDKPGILPNTGALELGRPTTLQVYGDVGGAASIWYFFIGDDGSDTAGCGVQLPGVGELLLCPGSPLELVGLSPANPTFPDSPVLELLLPASPEFAGLEIGMQAVGLLVNGAPPRLSRALVSTLEFAP